MNDVFRRVRRKRSETTETRGSIMAHVAQPRMPQSIGGIIKTLRDGALRMAVGAILSRDVTLAKNQPNGPSAARANARTGARPAKTGQPALVGRASLGSVANAQPKAMGQKWVDGVRPSSTTGRRVPVDEMAVATPGARSAPSPAAAGGANVKTGPMAVQEQTKTAISKSPAQTRATTSKPTAGDATKTSQTSFSSGTSVSTRDISRLDELNTWRLQVAKEVAKDAGIELMPFSLSEKPVLSGGRRNATRSEIAQGAAYPGKLVNDLVKAGMSRSKAQEAFSRKAIDHLNHREWPIISKPLKFAEGEFTSVQTPAKHIDSLAKGYKLSGINGVCSSERDRNDHAVNLIQSRLVDKDGKELFAGVRSGTIGADIKDPGARKHACHNRATETIKAALDLRPDLIAKAKNGEIPVLRMTSTSLMSPSRIATKEAAYLESQLQAWAEINVASQKQGFITITGFDNQPIRVKVEILPFSVGVNSFAFLGPSVLQGVIGGWDTSDKANAASISLLMDWTNEYIANDPTAANIAEVGTLRDEILDIFSNKLHHRDGGDPYKLAQRIQDLAYQIGAVPAWNCKSGKDRTGQCDVEVKAAIMLRRMGKSGATKPNAVPDSHQQHVLRTTQLESGTLEITKLNTGTMGLMINSGGILAASNAKRTGAGGEEDGLARALHD